MYFQCACTLHSQFFNALLQSFEPALLFPFPLIAFFFKRAFDPFIFDPPENDPFFDFFFAALFPEGILLFPGAFIISTKHVVPFILVMVTFCTAFIASSCDFITMMAPCSCRVILTGGLLILECFLR